MEVIETQDDLDAMTAEFRAECPFFAPLLDQTGQLPLRRSIGGFEGLLKIMVGQQVSTASAAAIWGRVQAAGLNRSDVFNAASDDIILAAGFSRPKLRYARALLDASLNLEGLQGKADVSVEETLTSVTGIGPWTAQIYLLTCLGRVDVFPAADLALQEAARVLLNLPERPTAKEMAIIAENWSPYRSVAARALWAYYRIIKQREGLA